MKWEDYNILYDRFKPEQDRAEFFWLVNEVEKINPHVIIEIGVRRGGSLKFWEQVVQPGDLVIGVDINPQVEWETVFSHRKVVVIRGDSRQESTVKRVAETLGGKQADFLFIDGQHSYETCLSDFNKYSGFVRKGGIVGFHDLCSSFKYPKKVFDMLKGRKKEKLQGRGTGIWWKE